MHKVVKPFPCSWDGFTLIDLSVGDERDFGSMAAGLVEAGYISEIHTITEAVIDLAPDEKPDVAKRPYKKRD
jgi:hypothetical protein